MPEPIAARPLSLTIEESGPTVTVQCHGRMVSGVTDYLYNQVKPLIPNHKQIVMDLGDLTHIDSMGVGALVRLYVSARAAGGELILLNVGKQVQRILGTTGLLSVFKVVGEHGIKIG
jgi:anti-sigma B factor antagonist